MNANSANKPSNNNPMWVVLLVLVIWLIIFIYRLKQAI